MKILIVVPSIPSYSGVDFHRLVNPHNVLGLDYPEFEVSMINEIDSKEIEFLKGFDLVVANRFISKTSMPLQLIEKLEIANVPYILDMDDDYKLPQDHILSTASRSQKHGEQIIRGLKGAYGVTCTHELMAATLKAELGIKKIWVVPNGINPVGQFEVKETNFDEVRFGWSGSITHFDDVLLMHDALNAMYHQKELLGAFKVVYGGFDRTDTISQAIAGVLSAKGKAQAEVFQMFGALDVLSYATFYDQINVMLIPLRANRFNSMKSNLKLLEAGFKKKAVIVSDVYPYSPILENKKNCLVVKHKNDWYKHMTYLIKNPSMIEDLSMQLYDDLQPYHMERIAGLRAKIYSQIMQEK